MAHDVLISYSTLDKLQADAICNRLESHGIRCWIAPRDVPPGSEYADSIVQAIEAARVMVLVYSANADESKQVRREVERAVATGITIMPVRIEAAEMSPAFEYYVASIHWLDAVTPPLEQHIDKLATDLRALLDKGAGKGAARGRGVPPAQPMRVAGHGAAPQDSQRGGHRSVRDEDAKVSATTAPQPSSLEQYTPPTPAAAQAPATTSPGGSRTVVLAGAAVLVAAALGVGVYLNGRPDTAPASSSPSAMSVTNPDALVPDLSDKSLFQARDALSAAGLRYVEREERHDELRWPRVIRTEPGAGQKAASGEVVVVVSGMRLVPDVVGKPLDKAKQMLSEARLAQPDVKTVAGAKAEGTVVSMTPSGGMLHFRDDPVMLEVVGGKVELPDVAGLDLADAEKRLKDARFAVKIDRDWIAGAEKDTVAAMAPPAGTKLSPGETVTLTVAALGGWVWAPAVKNLAAGKTFTMSKSGTLRVGPGRDLPQIGGDVISGGETARVLESHGNGWVKVAVIK